MVSSRRIKPTPAVGGMNIGSTSSAAVPGSVDASVSADVKRSSGFAGQLNTGESALSDSPVLAAAEPILLLAIQIRALGQAVDAAALHSQVSQLLDATHSKFKQITRDDGVVYRASLLLCTFIDEVVLRSSWGGLKWNALMPLSIKFHQTNQGGELVFQQLNECLQDVARYYDLLVLYYHVLSLGLMGKFGLDPHGAMQIESRRQTLFAALERNSREALGYGELNTSAPPVPKGKRFLYSALPLVSWMAFLVLLVGASYTWMRGNLQERSDQLQMEIAGLVPVVQPKPTPSVLISEQTLRLRQLLAAEIVRDVVRVDDYLSHTEIVLPSAALFGSGSAAINEAFSPVLDKISKALERTEGDIRVEGHTDNQPINDIRYPSNWHLSLARAGEVVKYMGSVAALERRLLPFGRGALEPIAPNETPEQRALNRRVVLKVLHGSSVPAVQVPAQGAVQ